MNAPAAHGAPGLGLYRVRRLLADDHITERTFGGYLSVYDFKRAVEDGATVPAVL